MHWLLERLLRCHSLHTPTCVLSCITETIRDHRLNLSVLVDSQEHAFPWGFKSQYPSGYLSHNYNFMCPEFKILIQKSALKKHNQVQICCHRDILHNSEQELLTNRKNNGTVRNQTSLTFQEKRSEALWIITSFAAAATYRGCSTLSPSCRANRKSFCWCCNGKWGSYFWFSIAGTRRQESNYIWY